MILGSCAFQGRAQAIRRKSCWQPMSPDGAESMACFVAGRHVEALAAAESALCLNPFFSQATRIAVASATIPGRMEDARKYLARLQMLDPELRVSNLADAVNFRRPDDFACWRRGCGRVACRHELADVASGGRVSSASQTSAADAHAGCRSCDRLNLFFVPRPRRRVCAL